MILPCRLERSSLPSTQPVMWAVKMAMQPSAPLYFGVLGSVVRDTGFLLFPLASVSRTAMYEAHPDSYPMATGDRFPGVKRGQ
jgi:hypothetical protein